MSNYKTYKVKLLTTPIREQYLNRLFSEGKWFYNMLLSDKNIKNQKLSKAKKVIVLNPITNQTEERDLLYLNSQIKQELIKRTITNMKSLKTRKKNGGKIGYLKFKKQINSIPLKNQTFKIERGRISFMGNYKLKFKCRGLSQVEEANKVYSATIVRKPSGFYIYFVCKVNGKQKELNGVLGVDFGIKNCLTFSNGQILDRIELSESKRLKIIQRKLAKSKKGSNNRYKLKHKLKFEYEKQTNKKDELTNQLLNILSNTKIIMQDENVSGWHKGLHGKQVQHSILGRIKKELISRESIVVGRFERTTRRCCVCHRDLEFGMKIRIIECPYCGNVINRDVNAAINILNIGLDESKLKPLESELDFNKFNSLLKHWTMKKEITTFMW